MYDDDDAVGARCQPRLCTADLRVLLSGALKMQDRTMTDTTVTKIAGREIARQQNGVQNLRARQCTAEQ